jgi:hypothetical protein
MKTDIEYAAMVVGISLVFSGAHASIKTESLNPYLWPIWRPERDDGDSRRLEIACLNWLPRAVPWPKEVTLAYAEFVGFLCSIDTTPEQYRTAVLALAVAIGKTISAGDAMEGNDNAGYLAGAIGKVMECNDNAG